MIDMKSFLVDVEKEKFHDKYLINIPNIIDIKIDNKLWDIHYNMNVIILDLVRSYVMKDTEIDLYVEEFNDLKDILCLSCDGDKLLYLLMNTVVVCDKIKEFVIINEFYESAANIRIFEKSIEML